MKRLTLIVASGVIGLALLVGATHEATANTSGQGDGVPCYYNLYSCSYEGSMSFWSGCDPEYQQGLIPTATAKVICSTYHG